MTPFEIIKCHGSGNDFIMVDTTCGTTPADIDWSAFARAACDRKTGIGSDGLLLVVCNDKGTYGMDMLNPDGTHAEMCGNGIRCVARLATERGYLNSNTLYSGGREFNISIATPIAQGIETFAVEIPIGLSSPSFAFYDSNARFVGEVIDKLDKNLRFTALNLGNPHIVAEVESIDMALLEHLGERVKSLTDIFPHGVNVSLYECRTRRSIFVATYERGAGITLSCGTAMTASATAAALLGRVDGEERIEVRNRGGKVYCTTRGVESPTTTLEGNATYNWRGMASFTDGKLSYSITEHTEEEQRWQMVAQGIE